MLCPRMGTLRDWMGWREYAASKPAGGAESRQAVVWRIGCKRASPAILGGGAQNPWIEAMFGLGGFAIRLFRAGGFGEEDVRVWDQHPAA